MPFLLMVTAEKWYDSDGGRMGSLTRARALEWLDRWDRQQQVYIADRDERFEVIGDLVAEVAPARARILDLGCGPGSLAARLATRFPDAAVIGIDADPLLLGLADAAYGGSVRFVPADLRIPGWTDALTRDGPFDAAVSTTALHWLTAEELGAVYRDVAALLRPEGVLVNGDHIRTGAALADRFADVVRDGRAARVGHSAEKWEEWWTAARQAPELAGLLGDRDGRPLPHHVPEPATLDDHVRLLRAAGFAEVTTVWQHGDDRVLVAVAG
jgi:SAM-dependent methyltransferase